MQREPGVELRVFHVQNWPQANDMLINHFHLQYSRRRERHGRQPHSPDDSAGAARPEDGYRSNREDGYHSHGVQKDMAGFSDWVRQKAPVQRAGKPLLQARTWRVSADPWRRITRCAIGLDTLRRYPCSSASLADPRGRQAHVASLSAYDANDIPFLECNIYAQRFAMYGRCPLL